MIEKSSRNSLSITQFFLLAFVATTPFKLSFMQQVFATIADRKAWLGVGLLALVEIAMLFVVFGSARKGGLGEIIMPKALRAFLAIFIAFSCFFRLVCAGGEFNDYVSQRVFDGAQWLVGLLAVLPVVAYLAHKGGGAIAKTCQIVFWLLAVVFLFDTIFAQLDGKFSNLLPLTLDGKAFVACDKALLWFADFSPLLFLSINGKDKRYSKVFVTLSCVGILLCPTLLALLMTIDYGGKASVVTFAFEKIAMFNKFSRLVGIVDLPTACAWLASATISLGLTVFGIVESISFLLKKLSLTKISIAVVISFGLVSALWANNSDKVGALSVSVFRYAVTGIEFLVPMIVYFFSRKSQLSENPQNSIPVDQNEQSQNIPDIPQAKKEPPTFAENSLQNTTNNIANATAKGE
ncbi:MAG: hypothetical protein RSB61_02870 [Clostridia bacterium]